MIITVQEIGKWGGLKAQDGNFYSPSKFAKGLPVFEIGQAYEIELKSTVSKKDGKTYTNVVAARPVDGVPERAHFTPTAVKPEVKVQEKPVAKAEEPKSTRTGVKKVPVAFGRELSDYEILKDKRIGVAGIMQALIQSPLYMPQVELMQDAAAVDKFIVEKAEFFLDAVKRLSEK